MPPMQVEEDLDFIQGVLCRREPSPATQQGPFQAPAEDNSRLLVPGWTPQQRRRNIGRSWKDEAAAIAMVEALPPLMSIDAAPSTPAAILSHSLLVDGSYRPSLATSLKAIPPSPPSRPVSCTTRSPRRTADSLPRVLSPSTKTRRSSVIPEPSSSSFILGRASDGASSEVASLAAVRLSPGGSSVVARTLPMGRGASGQSEDTLLLRGGSGDEDAWTVGGGSPRSPLGLSPRDSLRDFPHIGGAGMGAAGAGGEMVPLADLQDMWGPISQSLETHQPAAHPSNPPGSSDHLMQAISTQQMLSSHRSWTPGPALQLRNNEFHSGGPAECFITQSDGVRSSVGATSIPFSKQLPLQAGKVNALLH